MTPTSPYGSSKLAFEQLLHSTAHALGFTSIALRYFNASGARVEWEVEESHSPEEHLIPRVIKAIQSGSTVQIFGNDCPTPDGTCVRDYIHVWDLATAHIQALESQGSHKAGNFNVGSGCGHSVLEVIHKIAEPLNKSPNVKILPRRPGDPPSLVADPANLMTQFGWKPVHSPIEEIVTSSVDWEITQGRSATNCWHILESPRGSCLITVFPLPPRGRS